MNGWIQFTKLTLFTLYFILSQNVSFSQEYRANTSRSWKWTSNNIKVSWVNGSSNSLQEQKWVEDAIENSWEKESGLNFHWVPNHLNDYGIRIQIADEVPHTKGLGRALGDKPVGMVLNFDFVNWIPIRGGTTLQARNRLEYYIKVIAIHEFGHALGFAHEHARADCQTCDERQQGGEVAGDWYITTCDLNSVMNYCNPRYSNNGILSDGDIEGVQALYGPPGGYKPVSTTSSIKLVHTTFINNDLQSSTVKIFINGPANEINSINSVVYHLGNRFSPSTITANEPEDNFALNVTLNASIRFEISAEINYSDGTTSELTKTINFVQQSPGSRKVACTHQVPCRHKVTCNHQVNCSHRTLCQHRSQCQHQIQCEHRGPCQHQVQCQHRINCGHQMPCQHPYNTPYGIRYAHPYDIPHAFDIAHAFDLLHSFDFMHSYDVAHQYDLTHSYDLSHSFDLLHEYHLLHDHDTLHEYDNE